MRKPKISVIVPVYNNEKYLDDAVKSLLNQTYENLEIILVDDGSTDKTGEICDKYEKENTSVLVIHQENQGVSKARNKGFEKAGGELIGFCDGDDTVDEDYFEFLYNQMIETDSDISSCSLEVICENSRFYPKDIKGKHIWDNDEFIRHLLMGEVSIAVYTKLFRREIIEKISFQEDYKINEDKLFCFMAALNAEKISYQCEYKYQYFRREGTACMSAFSIKNFDLLKVADDILKIIKERKPHLTEIAVCNVLVAILILYKMMAKRNRNNEYSNYEKKIYDYVKSFDKKTAKKHLRKNDYIRFSILRKSRKLFFVFTKLIDKR